jgi:Tol biopolymer transport system component
MACVRGGSAVRKKRIHGAIMKNKLWSLAGCLLLTGGVSHAQPVVAPPESLVIDGAPTIPESVAEAIRRYGEYRSAAILDWHPSERSLLISTRFADTPQLHLVTAPGAARRQLTFYRDAVRVGRFHPDGGDYIVFSKDTGGGEWYQLYRYDVATGNVTLLTDGKSRNTLGPFASRGDRVAYTSTRRTGKDTDLWVMNPADPHSDRLLTPLTGGGWEPLDWSPDDSKILLLEELSINESYLWLVDTTTGEKTAFTPRDAKDKVSYAQGQFSKDGKGLYVTTDRDSEFHRLAYVSLGFQGAHLPHVGHSLGRGRIRPVERRGAHRVRHQRERTQCAV